MGDDFKNWNRLTEKEKSDPLKADLERSRSGRGPDIRCDGKQIEPRFARRVSARLGQMLSDGGETKETQSIVHRIFPHGREIASPSPRQVHLV